MNRAMNEVIKKHIILAIFTFIAVVLLASTATYAIFQIDKENTTNQKIAIGNLSANITSIEGAVLLNDLYPTLRSDLPEDYKYYEFTVENDGDYDLKYEIYLNDATEAFLASSTEYSSYKKINPDYYKYINFILDDGETQNLASIQNGEKFTLITGVMEPGYTKTHQIKFFIDKGETTTEGAPNDLGGSILSLDINLNAVAYDKCEPVYAVANSFAEKLINQANDLSVTDYSSGTTTEMYTFEHPETEQTCALTDYRYIGNTPNNYVTFNDETWRIIGVFTVENENGQKEQRIKIIRDTSLGSMTWDKKSDGTYTNEWPTSTLSTMLNGDYINKGSSFDYTWYNDSGTANTTTINGLNSTAQNQISSVKWYLGGNSTYENLGGPDYYSFERGTKVYSGRSTNVVAKVGLIYPSDYIYTYALGVDNTCYSDGYNCGTGTPSSGWLFNSNDQWTITPYSSSVATAFRMYNTGYVYSSYHVNSESGVCPVVFLESNIQLISGDGSSENPYKLKVIE